MRDVSVGIKAFIRVAELDAALSSLHPYDFNEVIVADDSVMTEDRRSLYARHDRYLPLTVLELPFRSGLAYGRNRMVENCTTDYFLLMDDDMALTSSIEPMRRVLDSDPQLGGVGALLLEQGKLASGCLNLHCFSRCLVLDAGYPLSRKQLQLDCGTRYYVYDMIDNFTLFKTKCLQDVSWDEKFLTNFEHADFYLSHKRLAKWRFALTPEYAVGHDQDSGSQLSSEYLLYRRDPALLVSTLNYFLQKWSVPDGMITGVEHLPRRLSLRGNLTRFKLLLNSFVPFYR